jgi:hypothetical protein
MNRQEPSLCCECEGRGEVVVDFTPDSTVGPGDPVWDTCPGCEGSGTNATQSGSADGFESNWPTSASERANSDDSGHVEDTEDSLVPLFQLLTAIGPRPAPLVPRRGSPA